MLLGTKAKHYFENFKKQWSKKRKDLRKVNISSTSKTIVEKAEKDLEPYLLFSYHSNFTRSIKIGILLNKLKNKKKKTNKHCKVISWKRVKLQKINTLFKNCDISY